MRPSQLTLGKVALAWAVLLFGAALILPNLDLHTRSYPAVKVLIAVYWVLLLVGTPVSLISYFNRAWSKFAAVPNRGARTVRRVFIQVLLNEGEPDLFHFVEISLSKT
jgi:hypothetical protein